MRMSFNLASALLAPLLLAACATPGQLPTSEADAQAASDARFDAMPDTTGTGPYPAIKEVRSDLADHVVYRPADLGSLGATKLGVIIWGNGGCTANAASARLHLLEIASHGYVVIAPGAVLSGPGATGTELQMRIQADGLFPPVETVPRDLLAGLDWILAENLRPGSPFFGRIDPHAVAAAGHSCGGLQAIAIAADPRIATTIVHNSGVINPGAANPLTGFSVSKDDLAAIQGPMLYILGGPDDIAFANGTDDFSRIGHIPVALANIAVGHGGTFREPNGGEVAQVALQWLNWQLRGDSESARWFTGDDCVVCTMPGWTVAAKGM